MVTLVNNFSEGSSGTTITSGNSGGDSQNAFDGTSSSGNTLEFTSGQFIHSSLSALCATSGAGGKASMWWAASLGTQSAIYGRVYMRFSAAPAENDTLIQFDYGSSSFGGGIQVTTALRVLLENEAGGTDVTFNSVIPVNTWIRIEFYLQAGPEGSASLEVQYFESADATTATETQYDTVGPYGSSGDINQVLFGWNNSFANQPEMWLAEIGVGTAGWFGPVSDFTHVQSAVASTEGTAAGSVTATTGAGITQNNLVLLAVCFSDSAALPVVPSMFTIAAGPNIPQGDSGPLCALYYAVVTASSAGTDSFEVQATQDSDINVCVSEWNSSRGWQASPLDQDAQGNIGSNPGPVTLIDSGTCPQTRYDSELWYAVLAYWGEDQSPYSNLSTGFSIDEDVGYSTSLASMTTLYQVSEDLGSPDCNYLITNPQYWAGVIAAFADNAATPVSSSDSGSGSDVTYKVTAKPQVLSDAGTGTDLGAIGKLAEVSNSDAGTGTDTQKGPATVTAASSDYGIGRDWYNAVNAVTVQAQFSLAVMEAFSLERCAVLTSGVESAQLYGAQQISLAPVIDSTDMMADDYEIGTWYNMHKATITVVNGFMSWKTISQLSGVSISSSGVSPADYYGLPLWTQYQHNIAPVPMAFRMTSRNSSAAIRTLDFVLYAVQLSVADFTGTVYKNGLGVSYAGSVLFSSYDEDGDSLAGPEIGRIVSYAGSRTGAFTAIPFRGM